MQKNFLKKSTKTTKNVHLIQKTMKNKNNAKTTPSHSEIHPEHNNQNTTTTALVKIKVGRTSVFMVYSDRTQEDNNKNKCLHIIHDKNQHLQEKVINERTNRYQYTRSN